MKYKITISLFLALLIFFSCHSQNSKFIDLATISNNFDVAGFYKNRVKKTNEIVSTNPQDLGKKKALELLDNAFFVKDTLGFYKTEGRFPTKLYLESTNEWMVRKQKPVEIFGFGYKTVAYNSEKDTLAILNNVPFPKMDMVEDAKGKLMYLEVTKTAKNISEFSKIKDYISKNCKKIAVDDSDQDVSYWEKESFYYSLSKKDNKEEVLSYDSDGNKSYKSMDVTEIRLMMFEKSFIKKMEELRIYSAGNKFWKKPL